MRAAAEILKASPNIGAFASAFFDMDDENDGEEKEIDGEEESAEFDDLDSHQNKFAFEMTDLNPVGALGKLIKMFRLPDDRNAALVQFERRARPEEILRLEPFPVFRSNYPLDVIDTPNKEDFEAYHDGMSSFFKNSTIKF